MRTGGFKFIHQSLSHKTIKKVQVIGAGVKNFTDHGLNQRFGHIHVTGKITKGHLRLHHPELGQVTAGIGIFSPERGAEGIYPAKGHGIDLGLELAADREPGPAAEKIIGKGVGTAKLSGIESGNGKHLAGTFTIGGGDNRGMNLVKSMVGKKLMDT